MDDQKRLSVVIDHWIEHNESHMAEYKKWSEKAGQLGLESTKVHIERAIENLHQCNLSLREALKGC